MKAEHRKELQTNVLADRVGHMIEGLRTGPKTSTIVTCGLVLLALVGAGAWRWISSSNDNTRSTMWFKFDGTNDIDSLQSIASESRGSMPARIARFQEARLLLRQGLEALCSDTKEANKKLKQASEQFEQLARDFRGDKLLTQEALMGAASAEESQGNLDKAQSLYQQLADQFGDSFLGQSAAKHVAELKDRRAVAQTFYDELRQRTNPPEPPGEPKKP
jgi:hypothetical protein